MPTTHFLTCSACGDGISEDCYDAGNYNYCGDCDAYFCAYCDCDRSHYEDNDDDYCGCSECREARGDSGSRIRPWDWRPPVWRPKGNYPAEPLLGLELEVGGSQSRIVQAVTQFDSDEHHVYMKYDGSIDGVELVTHPATLAWSRDYVWSEILGALRVAGSTVNDGYGLHIHVSRNAFREGRKQSATHQMSWLMFLYRHVFQLEQLARRRSDQWASFRAPAKGELRNKALIAPFHEDRYVAVNCNNTRTFELRFFKSTLDYTELMAALEFADASVHYTRSITTSDILRSNALTWQHFADWVAERDYPHLSDELARIAELPTPSFRIGQKVIVSGDDYVSDGSAGTVTAIVQNRRSEDGFEYHVDTTTRRWGDSWTVSRVPGYRGTIAAQAGTTNSGTTTTESE